MSNNDKWIYLMSSNATKEYLVDILEVLSLPFGVVQHFRYQLRWLDKNLKSILPIRDKRKKSELKNKRVVICYLYQEKRNSGWEWIVVYPIRLGILVDAYKTGDTDSDVSHFYFKVDNYIAYDGGRNFTEIIKNLADKKWDNSYAFLGVNLNDKYIANKKDSKSAFYTICNSLNFEYFKSPEGNEYFPIYCFIDGLKGKKNELLVPEYDSLANKSFYEITEGEHYSFQFSTYFPSRSPQYVVKFLSDGRLFSTPSEYKLEASSRYDEESWIIVSSLLDRDTWTSLSFKN